MPPTGVGLEAGSKPELLIALALLDTPEALLICNGYKDRAYIETALLAQRLGRIPVIVVDRAGELDLILQASRELGIRPHIGLRARLSTVGAGRWIESSGSQSKFGLTPDELVRAVERLREADMLDCAELLHFHIGSQITTIRAHKDALREAMRIYVGLHELGASSLHLLDVGGGLGVDYVGAGTDDPSSMNYTEQEYANDVIFAAEQACSEAGVPAPDIITESGRAMAAHHSVLVFDVMGVNRVEAPTKLPGLRGARSARPACAPRGRREYPPGEPERVLPRHRPRPRRGGLALLPRLPGPARAIEIRATLPRRLRAHRRDPRAARRGTRRVRGPAQAPHGYLFREFLGLPIGPGHLGRKAGLSGHADPPVSARSRAAGASSST